MRNRITRGLAVAATAAAMTAGLVACSNDGEQGTEAQGTTEATPAADAGMMEGPDATVPAIDGPVRDMCGEDLVAAMAEAGFRPTAEGAGESHCEFEGDDSRLAILMNDPTLQYDVIKPESRLVSVRDDLIDDAPETVWAVPDRPGAGFSQCIAGETAGDGTMQYLLLTEFGPESEGQEGVCRSAAQLYLDVTGR